MFTVATCLALHRLPATEVFCLLKDCRQASSHRPVRDHSIVSLKDELLVVVM